jgi:hypothetical protein
MHAIGRGNYLTEQASKAEIYRYHKSYETHMIEAITREALRTADALPAVRKSFLEDRAAYLAAREAHDAAYRAHVATREAFKAAREAFESAREAHAVKLAVYEAAREAYDDARDACSPDLADRNPALAALLIADAERRAGYAEVALDVEGTTAVAVVGA